MKTISAALSLVLAFTAVAGAYDFRTVIIDPGHGGHDKGGQWGRVYEKHLALDTSVRLEAHLKKMGYNTVLTRRSDYFVSLPGRMTVASSYKNAIFISIHYNYTWKQDVSGIETFYNTSTSKKLADAVHSGMMSRVKVNDRKVKYARYYVIRNCSVPSILVEGGFVSNSNERSRMKTAWFRDAIARGIADGVQRFRRGG
ncbi:MAG: N-acetylmuramoyl-L-alanine amidase [Akkermansiaceae bacterium]|jgi:N-acetylmuramoyl-L-alanine amidase|nr:N-acetylmuramoyl-L-alanine amidase [Akkermansiaceae bacterium]MDP4648012.1 N-acetylmuramoyl-L-alanine amidase [Akkermansiaceae bacterium]MDP4720335.1 N-acetylmuramoyl-L-alanine amidase [Akkermansiaceae bacterium]MDP4781360.1 N-acetylmuramoyl-L-alanine amidase [Akkermansiaceae bacterium]MDP4848679.1 N-acetylmuramoyl-L-alanine amidase [Akkermansiaceae bacterium]